MSALPTRFYRNPLEILEWAERNSCKGCVHKTKAWGVEVCGHPSRKGGKADRRCSKYNIEEETK